MWVWGGRGEAGAAIAFSMRKQKKKKLLLMGGADGWEGQAN
jgi:hypothetical protein